MKARSVHLSHAVLLAGTYLLARLCGRDRQDALLAAVACLLTSVSLYAELEGKRLGAARRRAVAARGWRARASAVLYGETRGAS